MNDSLPKEKKLIFILLSEAETLSPVLIHYLLKYTGFLKN